MTIVWHWPQIVVVSLFAISVLIAAAKDGEPIKDPITKYSAGRSIVRALIWLGLAYFGGFFAGASP